MGRRAAAHRDRVGESLRVGIRAHSERRRFPWGDASPTSEFANLGGDALRPAPVGAYPDGASAYGVRADARRRVGVDVVAAAAVARIHADDLPALLGTLLRGQVFARAPSTATTGCCAAGRGPSHARFFGRASATGTTRFAGRSSRACGWPGTPSDVPAPRLARRAALAGVAGARAAVWAWRAVVFTASPEARTD